LLAAALGKLGRAGEGRAMLDKAIALSPRDLDVYACKRVPWLRPEDYEHMLDGLRKVGWQGRLSLPNLSPQWLPHHLSRCRTVRHRVVWASPISYTTGNPTQVVEVFPKGRPLNHIGVEVDDLDATEARVVAAGLKPFSHADYEPGRRFSRPRWHQV
jgi:hypothetical protein